LGTLEASLETFERLGDTYWANQTRARLASVYTDLGRLDEAEEFLRVSLAESHPSQAPSARGATLWLVATVAFKRGRSERAVRLMGFPEALAEHTGSTPPSVLLGDLVSQLAEGKTELGEDAVDRLRAEGRSMSADEAIAYAMGED
jgi:hypothetical protein